MIIRSETGTPDEAAQLGALVTRAFKTLPVASGTEAEILARLRDEDALLVALVAEEAGELIGQVSASPATIGGQGGWACIAPLSVEPDRHRQGVGTALMRAVLEALVAQGAAGAVLVGEPEYYGRFGFAADPQVSFPGVPGEYVLLHPFAGSEPRGEVRCHPALMP